MQGNINLEMLLVMRLFVVMEASRSINGVFKAVMSLGLWARIKEGTLLWKVLKEWFQELFDLESKFSNRLHLFENHF